MVSTIKPHKWVLASGSKHRLKQLNNAGLQVEAQPPNIDEHALEGETPIARALRLAELKAQAISEPDAITIGGDQVAHLDGLTLHKPGTLEKAEQQLMTMQGRWVNFESAVCVVCDGARASEAVTTRILFRSLTAPQIRTYLKAETPFDAAGSFYSEARGGWLMQAFESPDPTAIVGLPLMALGRCLRQLGIDPLDSACR